MDREESLGRLDGWVETEATITSCKRTLLSSVRGTGMTDDRLFEPPEYTVAFRYTVDGRTFDGRYAAYSDQAIGSTLTIAYDPKKPGRNTGSDLKQNLRIRIFVWSIGLGLAALAAWLGFADVPPF